MNVDAVRKYLKGWGKDTQIKELSVSCATVELAAKAVGVAPQRIAKTLSFKAKTSCLAEGKPGCILVVAAGDTRIDGKKFKERFGLKSKMLSPEEALACTGHAVGGVCPFAVDNPHAEIYLDVSLRRFSSVFTACGSSNSLMEMTSDELFVISRANAWVDVCRKEA
jgi:prolyl-tRNA editing enzyme YbaK/EbsC (Cys-tRNA(Pro) deacylase)